MKAIQRYLHSIMESALQNELQSNLYCADQGSRTATHGVFALMNFNENRLTIFFL